MPSMDKSRPLGEKDEALIRLLQADARASVSELARRSGVSRTAVQERLNRLQRQNIIEGFTVKLNRDWQKSRITTFIALSLNPKYARQVIRALEHMPCTN